MSKIPATQPGKAVGAADAIALLTREHKEVHALFRNHARLVGKDPSGDERQPLAGQICRPHR